MTIHKGKKSQGSLLVFKSKRYRNIKESLTKAESKGKLIGAGGAECKKGCFKLTEYDTNLINEEKYISL